MSVLELGFDRLSLAGDMNGETNAEGSPALFDGGDLASGVPRTWPAGGVVKRDDTDSAILAHCRAMT